MKVITREEAELFVLRMMMVLLGNAVKREYSKAA